jgi:hypothetical protein
VRFIDKDGKAASQAVKGKFNFGLGWIIGDFLPFCTLGYVVDAVTGAMWRMPSFVTLENISYNFDATQQLFMVTLEDIRPEMRQYLIPVESFEIQAVNF